MREKLIELLEQAKYCSAEELADYLIEAGLLFPKRCKECALYDTFGCADGFGWCAFYDAGMMDNDFCSHAGTTAHFGELEFDYNAEDVWK